MGEWRVGRTYGLHVYEGRRPVATFHDGADAARAVADHNRALRADEMADVVSDAELELDTLPTSHRADMFTLCRAYGFDPLLIRSVRVVAFSRSPDEPKPVSALRFNSGGRGTAGVRPLSVPLPAWWQPA